MIHGSRNRTGDRLPEVEVGIPHDVKDRQKLRDASGRSSRGFGGLGFWDFRA